MHLMNEPNDASCFVSVLCLLVLYPALVNAVVSNLSLDEDSEVSPAKLASANA